MLSSFVQEVECDEVCNIKVFLFTFNSGKSLVPHGMGPSYASECTRTNDRIENFVRSRCFVSNARNTAQFSTSAKGTANEFDA